MKSITTMTIDTDILEILRIKRTNVSSLCNTLLRQYLNIKEVPEKIKLREINADIEKLKMELKVFEKKKTELEKKIRKRNQDGHMVKMGSETKRNSNQ